MTGSTPTGPDATQAADFVATADRLQRAVRDGASWHYVGWLTGMAVATVMYFAGLGVTGPAANAGVIVLSAVFGVCVFGLSVGLLPGARVSKAGFPRRWTTAVATWGVLYGLALGLGLGFFRGELAFWLPAAVLTALPLVLGARAEATA